MIEPSFVKARKVADSVVVTLTKQLKKIGVKENEKVFVHVSNKKEIIIRKVD